MVAYDSAYGATPPAGKRSSAADKISNFLGRKTSDAGLDPVAPPAVDYALTPDENGKITLAGRKVPVALALIGAAVVGGLLINKRTRGPVIAGATTAWGFLGKKAL
jgi:hypothetical protein